MAAGLAAIAALLFFCSAMGLSAQGFQWARMGGGDGWKHGNAIVVDNAKNSFAVGEFSGAEGAGSPGMAFDNVSLTSKGNADGFIVMYDPSGIVQWVLQIGKPGGSVAAKSIAVATSSTGRTELYVTGEFDGTDVDFGGGKTGTGDPGSSFIAKYTVITGITQAPPADWVAVMSPPGSDQGRIQSRGIAVGNAGTIYLCGTMRQAVKFGSVGGGVSQSVNETTMQDRIFVAKYSETILGNGSSQVDAQWVKTSQGTVGSAFGTAVAITTEGDAIATGYFIGTISLSSSITLSDPIQSSADTNLVIARFATTAGAVQWAARGGEYPSTPGSMEGRGIAIGEGKVYVTGRFTGDVRLDQPTSSTVSPVTMHTDGGDFFVVRYDIITGTHDVTWWARSNTGLTGEAFGNGIAVRNEKVFVTGGFSGIMALDASNSVTLGSLGNHDIFVVRYDAGIPTVDWAQRAGNTYTDTLSPNYDQGRGIAVAADGSAYITGEFGGTAQFFDLLPPLHFDHFRNVFTARLWPDATKVTGTVTMSGQLRRNQIVAITDPAIGTDYVTTGANGIYTAFLPKTATSFIVQALRPAHWKQSNPVPPANDYYEVLGTGPDMANQNFAFDILDTVTDLRVTMVEQSPAYAAPSSTIRYLIRYKNVGTRSIAAATITLDFDPRLTLHPSIVSSPGLALPSTGNSNNERIWQIPSPFNPMEEGEIVVSLDLGPVSLSPTAPPDVVSNVVITDKPEDETHPNNTASVVQEVFQPSDPNAKFSTPAGNIGVAGVRQGMDLKYTIDFFNVGHTPATMVRVYDTLDATAFSFINPITVLSASPVQPVASHGLLANEQLFTFDQANLASIFESTSASHGFLTFSVRLKPDIPIGQKIYNYATIQFDGLTTIRTNRAENCITPEFVANGVCEGETTQFTTRIDGANSVDYLWDDSQNITAYLWDFGDGTTDSKSRNPEHLYAEPGTYLVRITVKFEVPVWICDRLYSSYVVEKPVQIHPFSEPSITRSRDTLISSPAASYQWYHNGTAISGATGQRYLFSPTEANGMFTVTVTNGGGCQASANIALSEVPLKGDENLGIRIRPNPGTGPFTLDLGRPMARAWKLSVTDMLGEVILARTITEGKSSCNIDLAGQPSGIYTARITIDGEIITRRFVLQR